MGTYLNMFWDSDNWYGKSGAYHPYIPDMLQGIDFRFDSETTALMTVAQQALTAFEVHSEHLTDTEPLARLLMRSEALASSRIEGLEAPAKKLLEYEALDELGVSHRLDSAEAATLANIGAMRSAIENVRFGTDITLDQLSDINRQLLAGSALAEQGGVVRSTQNWIGGSDFSPVAAAYVPPTPEHVEPLLHDLLGFCNTSTAPALAKAAIAHAQFESIHPYADGNGRTGRALIQMVLRRDGAVSRTVPPISLILATRKRDYLEQLSAFRSNQALTSETGMESVNELVSFFAKALIEACERSAVFEGRIATLKAQWQSVATFRKGSAAAKLLELLPGNPVVSIASVCRLTGASKQSARLAIESLVSAGILRQNSKNRKNNLFAAEEVLSEFTAFERALSVPSGDTAIEKPARPVPQRDRGATR